MDFSLSEDQEMLKTMARDFLETECPESVIRDTVRSNEGYSPELWRKVADLGWMGIIFPEKYGGTEQSIVDLAVLYEEMGRGLFASPHLSTVVLCGSTILAAGSEAQKADLLPKIINGELVLALALIEPGSSWDSKTLEPEGVTVSATPDGNDYIINGTKLFVHDAHVADYLLCATRTKNGGAAEKGITLFLVDAKSPGVKCTLLDTVYGDNKQSEVVFNKVRVPKKNMVGKLNGGWAPLARSMQIGAVMLCAQMVGAGQKVLELTVDYAKTRIQFDMPIGINQHVQAHCVYLVADVDTSRWVTYLAAWKLSENMDCDLDVSVAKAWTSEAYERACWYSHQVFAGVGSTEALGVIPLYTRMGNLCQYYLGSPNEHMEVIARELEKLPLPERPKAKPLGLWKPSREQLPTWDIWRDYYLKNR
jgi:alkylation response protein AidB-like acyl-CoA dehydrogenase